MNFSNSFDKTDGIYALAPADDLARFWRLKVKVTAGGVEGVCVDAGASQVHLLVNFVI